MQSELRSSGPRAAQGGSGCREGEGVFSWDPDTTFHFVIEPNEELWSEMVRWFQHFASCDEPPVLCEQTRTIKKLALAVASKATQEGMPFPSLHEPR